MENQPIRIMVPFDSLEDKEILEQMPKWAKGSWIREQVRKAVLMEKDTRNQEILELVNTFLSEQGSITQNQVRNWIAESLQYLPSTTGDQVQEIVAEVLQKQMAVTEQQVKRWVNEAVSALQVTEHQKTTIEADDLGQNDPVSIAEVVDDLQVPKYYEILQSEPVKQIKRRSVCRSIHDVVERRPTVKAIETVASDRSVEEKDECAEYGKVDLTHLEGIIGFGGSEGEEEGN